MKERMERTKKKEKGQKDAGLLSLLYSLSRTVGIRGSTPTANLNS